MDKVRVIASTTYQEASRQPIYYILIVSFALLILLSRVTTLFAFEEESRMIREMAVASIVLCGVLLSIVISGSVITSEIDRRTAITVLSKPVNRVQFFLGKYFGILRANFYAFLVLLCAYLVTLWWQDGQVAFETYCRTSPAKDYSFATFLRDYGRSDLFPAVGCAFLGFLEVAILTAASVMVAFHAPMVVNGAVCLGLFLLGHLSRFLSLSLSTVAHGTGKVIYSLLPTLDFYNLSDYVAGGGRLTPKYLGYASLYAALYVGILLVIGSSLFARKEIQ